MVFAELEANQVKLELSIPWVELKYALPARLAEPPLALQQTDRELLDRYVIRHVSAMTADAAPWSAELTSLDLRGAGDAAEVHVEMRLRPPGDQWDSFVLKDDAVTHLVMSHMTLVFVRDGRKPRAEPQLIGMLQNPHTSLTIRRQAADTSFPEAFVLGAKHIATGADHLLFLLTLLLPAPLIRGPGGEATSASVPEAVRRLASIVTAFTVGHSAALILGAFGGFTVNQQPVEVAIAATILVAAIGAWRPVLFDRAPAPLIAGLFGGVHGLAFSAALAEHTRSATAKAVVVVGFNLGIEAVQLAIVLLVAPLLVLLARRRGYGWVQRGGAAAAGTAALVWIAQRALAIA